jgi:4,5-DOPA dioxygenase extradiol
MNTMPAIFIGHGSPMNIVEKNDFTDFLIKTSKHLPKPKCILAISAHWLTEGLYMDNSVKMKAIYDFYGFPEHLYNFQYNPSGFPELFEDIQKEIPELLPTQRGLDHGVWSVLKYIFPECNIPVITLSININLDLDGLWNLSKKIAEFRKEGILILGSGNITHNLRVADLSNRDSAIDPICLEFDSRFSKLLTSENRKELLSIFEWGEITKYAHPSIDHLLPALQLAAMGLENEKVTILFEGFQNKSISMRCFGFV